VLEEFVGVSIETEFGDTSPSPYLINVEFNFALFAPYPTISFKIV
jgi:hypothetical protein